MEKGMEDLVERLMRENEEFRNAKQAHAQLEKELEAFLTPQEEIEIKIIKKKKLFLKDQMERILMKYK